MAGQSMKLNGTDFLSKQMKAFGPTVAKAAAKTGLRKAGLELRKQIWRAAPKRGNPSKLKKSIGLKSYGRWKNPSVFVGLRKAKGETRGLWYYRTLEVDHKRGKAYNPFFEKTYNRHRRRLAKFIVSGTIKSLYTEAEKVYAKSVADQSRYGQRRGRVR